MFLKDGTFDILFQAINFLDCLKSFYGLLFCLGHLF